MIGDFFGKKKWQNFMIDIFQTETLLFFSSGKEQISFQNQKINLELKSFQ